MMARQRKRHRLPYWVRSQEFRMLNNSEKNFLGYLYSFGPDTCWLWNWRLQKKFHRSKRTIQYWLAKLKDLGFIWIEKPYGPERKIHARTLITPEHWVKLIGALALGKHLRRHKRSHSWKKTSRIELAKRTIINELMRRGESLESAAKVAELLIDKEAQKKGLGGCKKLHP